MEEKLKALNIGQVLNDEPMKRHTSFKIGGPVKVMCLPDSYEKAQKLVNFLRQEEEDYYVIGNGSNLLVDDRGLDLVIIKIGKNLSNIKVQGTMVEADAGASLMETARKAMDQGLAGMETLAGIPGNIGGAITMNAGAYGGEIAHILHSATVINPQGDIVEIPADQMNLSYRHSRVMEEDLVVLGAKFQLEEGDKDEILVRFQDLQKKRRDKQPLDKLSAGSTFKRPQGHYAAQLIEEAGLKGYTYKGAMVSDKHSGFIIADKDSNFEEVMEVINHVQEVVYEKFQVKLEPEVRILTNSREDS